MFFPYQFLGSGAALQRKQEPRGHSVFAVSFATTSPLNTTACGSRETTEFTPNPTHSPPVKLGLEICCGDDSHDAAEAYGMR